LTLISVYAFKVKDYSTILVGQKEIRELKSYKNETERYQTYYYVQRGDGVKYSYHQNEVEWVKYVGEFSGSIDKCY